MNYWSWPYDLAIKISVWEDGAVIFNQLTQDTHLLKSPSVWILRKLEFNCLSLDALAMLAIQEDIMMDDKDSRKSLEIFLNSLEQLDLLTSTYNESLGNSLA
ncbi:hypothetical protein GO003_019520 [Methylicorpusculum oleiharenae]|uniref:hypothetical protein n=1 Tax=Methylicorpusculum oleiharenae TaxID=1338687 RepID=UPI00135CB1C3|nr:hypothetical protein [Methylicorpusculum oleiharenae]MCD2452577.1 hypothetical protein [Methylicorpusculum oleiharenae]